MSRKMISHNARPKGPSPEQIRRRNLLIGMMIALVAVLVFIIGDSANKGGNRLSDEQKKQPAGSPEAVKATRKVTIDTVRGQFVLEVYPDLMPITVANFEKLVNAGFYDGLKWHRVEHWVIQGGDPIGNGSGGPGWKIKLETNPELKNVRGAVGMARSRDRDSAGSQFYILKKDAPSLDGDYAIFGKVVQGMDVVDQIQQGDIMSSVKE